MGVFCREAELCAVEKREGLEKPGGDWPIPGSAQGQAGQGLGHPGTVGSVPAMAGMALDEL